MAETTEIAWTDATFNPWIGCTKVAPECAECYAEDYANRYGRAIWGAKGTRSKTSVANWRKPLKWNREAEAAGVRRKVFCASLADVFEDWQGPIVDTEGDTYRKCRNETCGWRGLLPVVKRQIGLPPHATVIDCPECGEWVDPITMDDLRRDLFTMIDETPNLEWLLLTKRPENIRRMWLRRCSEETLAKSKASLAKYFTCAESECERAAVHRPNVRLGTSAGCQATADKALPHLRKCRDLAAGLFVSCEPMLDAVEFADVTGRSDAAEQWGKPFLEGIDQLIIGVESNGKRVGRLGTFKSEADWCAHAARLVEQCHSAGVAAFVKQIPVNGMLEHDVVKFPAELRYQESPIPAAVEAK